VIWSGGASPQMTRYLFIDGAYLAAIYRDLMQEFWKIEGEIDFVALKKFASADKVFYYDCVDDVARSGEIREQVEARVRAKDSFLDGIRELPGYHVQEGRIAGVGRRRRQKRVDVQLAVDMLMHATHRNMTHATLLAGDEDFLPLIEALEGLGTDVTVIYERQSGARTLHWAADAGVGITIREAYSWTSIAVRAGLTIPQEVGNAGQPPGMSILRSGTVMGRNAALFGQGGPATLVAVWVEPSRTESSLTISFDDQERLLKYVELCYGPITWKN
jgi:uncharacterized LabA/DUF88 family protein